jgi:hypothetical protein
MRQKSEFENRRKALMSEITSAFEDVELQDGITLHEAVALDNYASQEERMAARRRDRHGSWKDVRDEEIAECESALSFVDWKGFRYYLPAFMLYSLSHWNYPRKYRLDDKSRTLHGTCYHLLNFYPKSLRQSEPRLFVEKYKLSSAQCRAIASFLRFTIDFDNSSADEATVKAVERWEQFSVQGELEYIV